MSAENEVAALRSEVMARQRERASAEHALVQAEARQETAAAALLEEFGVASPEEAEALAEALDTELAAEAAAARALLARTGDT
jgi:argininosuccinate lyase